MVQILLKAGANINAINIFGQTALGKAAALGNFDAVVALIEAGADNQISCLTVHHSPGLR